MERVVIKTHSRLPHGLRRARWGVVGFMLLLLLAGCLTSHAAGPAGEEPDADLSSLPDAATASPTPTSGGVTLVPNSAPALLAFQTVTPTVTATAEAPTDIPDTPTPSPEPTNTPEPAATATPSPTNTPAPTPIPATLAPFQAYAWLDNYYPAPGSVVTVHGRLFRQGRPVNGAQMGVTWGYTHGRGYCTAYTGIDGRAACSQNIGAPLPDYWVFVDVVFVYDDELYYAKTAFLTDP